MERKRYYDKTTGEIFNQNLLDNVGKPSGLTQKFEYERRKNGSTFFLFWNFETNLWKTNVQKNAFPNKFSVTALANLQLPDDFNECINNGPPYEPEIAALVQKHCPEWLEMARNPAKRRDKIATTPIISPNVRAPLDPEHPNVAAPHLLYTRKFRKWREKIIWWKFKIISI